MLIFKINKLFFKKINSDEVRPMQPFLTVQVWFYQTYKLVIPNCKISRQL